MNHTPTRITVAVATALSILVAGTASADNKVYRALDGDRVEVTTFEGKPPHSRRIVKVKDLSVAEFARFEETKADAAIDRSKIGKTVRIIDRSGKPPFAQRVVTITEENAAEFARFEEETEAPKKLFRGPSARSWPAR
jgi:hypothetical protein